MATVVFYAKPGCQSNRRQRDLLVELGHAVEVRDLLDECWNEQRLRAFFGTRPVSFWFNPHAPVIQTGELNPHHFSEADALRAMVRDPILIRGPLLETAVGRCAGFDRSPVLEFLGVVDDRQDRAVCTRSGGVTAPQAVLG